MRILFTALMAVPVLIFFIAYLSHKSGSLPPLLLLFPPQAGFVAGFCALLMAVAYVRYGLRKRAIRSLPTLQEKLGALEQASRAKYWLQEASTLVGAIAFALSGAPSMQALFLVLLVAMGLSNPTIFSIMNDLKLSKEEAQAVRRNLPLE
jgi:hypothetical protein